MANGPFSNSSETDDPLNGGMLVLRLHYAVLLLATAVPCLLTAQTPAPAVTITLTDALTRARQYGTQIQSASLNSAIAQEDTKQARAGRLPTVNAFNQMIYTQGDGTPS